MNLIHLSFLKSSYITIIRRVIVITIIALSLFSAKAMAIEIIPKPLKVVEQEGEFILSANTKISISKKPFK